MGQCKTVTSGWRKRGGGLNMAHGDGGKGSGRRVENSQAVRDGWDRIFGKKQEVKEMIDDDDYEDEHEEEHEHDDTCTWCGGCGEGDYDGAACRKCHGTGVEPFDGVDDDYI